MSHGACRVVVFVCLALLLVSATGFCANDQLTVVQDESSMERTIEAYLKGEHDLVVQEVMLEEDDLALSLPYDGDPMPDFRVTVDSQPLNRDEHTGKVIERGLVVNLFTGVMVPESKFEDAIRVINELNRRKVFASVYIDTDGEIVLSWTLNVLEQGLATEYVYDAIVRLVQNWDALWKELEPVLGH